MNRPLYLGCPVWNCDQWGGNVYPIGTKRADWLSWYVRTFNTVEGNSTFYGLPKPETVARWAEQAATGFKFALKVPRAITHDMRLHACEGELRRFYQVLEPLAAADALGPSFVQLPPDFSPAHFSELKQFLQGLPRSFPWAVEVRHHDWYDAAEQETRLDDLLLSLEMDKVLFDSRPLYSLPAEDEHEKISQTRKPKTPYRETVTAKHPFVRVVGRNRIEQVREAMDGWASVVANWIKSGLKPYVFTHAPDDAFAPDLARMFADQLRQKGVAMESIPKPPRPAEQQMLFD